MCRMNASLQITYRTRQNEVLGLNRGQLALGRLQGFTDDKGEPTDLAEPGHPFSSMHPPGHEDHASAETSYFFVSPTGQVRSSIFVYDIDDTIGELLPAFLCMRVGPACLHG